MISPFTHEEFSELVLGHRHND